MQIWHSNTGISCKLATTFIQAIFYILVLYYVIHSDILTSHQIVNYIHTVTFHIQRHNKCRFEHLATYQLHLTKLHITCICYTYMLMTEPLAICVKWQVARLLTNLKSNQRKQ